MARPQSGGDAGCGAVAGRVTLEPAEEGLLPQALMRRTERENAYEQALLALSARSDPVAHDPWPNPWTASGASYGVTLDAYRAIGGLPYPASGEDRALADALLRHDIPIRHDPDIVVVTSARLDGRACGGVADTIRMRCEDPDVPGDERLEPLANAALGAGRGGESPACAHALTAVPHAAAYSRSPRAPRCVAVARRQGNANASSR